MSQNFTSFNFSRRVASHNQAWDFNHALNKKAYSSPWLKEYSRGMAQTMVTDAPPLVAMYGIVGVSVILTGWSIYNSFKPEKYRHNGLKDAYYLTPTFAGCAETFIPNDQNRRTKLGKWNHNFFCYEKQYDGYADYE